MEQKKQSLLEALAEFNNTKSSKLEYPLRQRSQANLEYIKTLSPLETTYGRKIDVHSLTKRNATELHAFRWHRCKATVEQYYFIKHNITLTYPNLPCIVVKGGNGHLYFYPIEMLYIPSDLLSENLKNVDLNE